MKNKKIKSRDIKTRDHNMVKVINGATKAGIHKDRKKEKNKYASREKVRPDKCRQCNFPLPTEGELLDYEEDGFCSLTCFDYHTSDDFIVISGE